MFILHRHSRWVSYVCSCHIFFYCISHWISCKLHNLVGLLLQDANSQESRQVSLAWLLHHLLGRGTIHCVLLDIYIRLGVWLLVKLYIIAIFTFFYKLWGCHCIHMNELLTMWNSISNFFLWFCVTINLNLLSIRKLT